MIHINPHYLKLRASYLFSDIAKRVADQQQHRPDATIIRLGIGDVTRALPEACITALHQAVDEMAADSSFRGYGPEQGYGFLREAIAANDFQSRNADIHADEIFVSDGAKCDTGNIQEIFDSAARIAIPDPVYPVYLDTNVMAGRTGKYRNGRYAGVVYLDSTAANGFIPDLPQEPVDLIYLCFPNNPTGTAISTDQLKQWVDYAAAHRAIILYDAAYEAFVRDESLPRSIFEIEGARNVAIEFRSFSKTAGFTGTRCAYTVVPRSLMAYTASGEAHSVHRLWSRRHSTKFNGVAYPVQCAAAATYSAAGKEQVAERVHYYMTNADLIRNALQNLGYLCVGGENAPYLWVSTGTDSWAFFDMLLEKAGVVCTPGAGFGACGEGYIRISAFNSRENVTVAISRMQQVLGEHKG